MKTYCSKHPILAVWHLGPWPQWRSQWPRGQLWTGSRLLLAGIRSHRSLGRPAGHGGEPTCALDGDQLIFEVCVDLGDAIEAIERV